MTNNIPAILDAFYKVTAEKSTYDDIWVSKYTPPQGHAHQFLFFIKPEATNFREGVNVDVTVKKALELLEKGVDGKPVKIGAVRVVGGSYLDKHSIMVQHYGVIAKISREGESAISESARDVLKSKFGEDFKNWTPEHYKSHVLGGHQFIQKFPQFNAFSLLALNDNLGPTRLGPGTYAIKVKVRGELFIVLNSFHAFQVVPYNTPGNAIIVFECQSEACWEDLRSKLAGPTDPSKAPDGSIRAAFLKAKTECGLKEVNSGSNCIHMSAGPLEGMIEIQRFFSDSGHNVTVKETAFGSLLLSKSLPEEKITKYGDNPVATYKDKKASVFDLTEEKDAEEAANILSSATQSLQ